MNIEAFRVNHIDDYKSFALAVGNLYDYLSELKNDFFEFDYQRGIVSNPYLDSLSDSVIKGLPFPAITLTANQDNLKNGINELDLTKCEILDGLQRTFRLWSIYYISEFINNHTNSDYRNLYDLLKKDERGTYIIKNNVVNRSSLKKLLIKNERGETELDSFIRAFQKYEITINIWSGLSDEEVVKQMLVLNAGHKRVSKYLQFEIIYLHYFKENKIKLPAGVKVIREKDVDYKLLGKAESRKIGMYALSSIIIAFNSYFSGRPQRVQGVNQVKMDVGDSEIAEYYSDILIGSVLSEFVSFMYEIDKKISYDSEAGYWYSKETTLSGLFAAIGSKTNPNMDYKDFSSIKQFINSLQAQDLNLKEYYDAYRKVSSINVNVGSIIRKGVYNAFINYTPGEKIDWILAFEKR